MSIFLLLKCLVRTLFVIINNAYCIPTSCLWLLFLQPLRFYMPDLYWKIEGTFFHWLLAMVSMWSWSAGYDVVEIGDDIRPCLEDRTLVVANHQSTADVPMLMANFNPKKGVLPNIMWIMDRVFKFTNFGIVSVLHQDFFILSGRAAREEAVNLLKIHIRNSYIPLKRRLMVLFPEGGFLRNRRETSKRYAQKNNLPLLTNVTLPRMGAMLGIMDILCPPAESTDRSMLYTKTKPHVRSQIGLFGLRTAVCYPLFLPNGQMTVLNHPSLLDLDVPEITRDELRWVLDVTIAYPEGKPLDLPTIITGSRPACQTFMIYRLYPSSEIPRKQDDVTKWLVERWEEKDRILDAYYRTGEIHAGDFCKSPLPPQVAQQDPLRFLVLHLFFIASSYLHFKLIAYALSLIWLLEQR